MPELPEVEKARALVERGAVGRVIESVDDLDTYVCRPHAPGELDDALARVPLSFAALILAAIAHTFNFNRDFHIPAAEVAEVEKARSRQLGV